jgi:BirA family transcriptional regulator, biotin operon repressor / biotin---[acetyl-CoA-carboxylase] ligase
MHHFKIIPLQETASTNLHASALLSGNENVYNTVIVAKSQNSGKGQGDNLWQSDYDKNILCSIIVSSDFVKPMEQFRLSKITSLAVHNTIESFKLKPTIKWPNDILIKNKKIAGILIENTILHDHIISSVIGIGLNVNQQKFPEFTNEATSLFLETKKEYDLNNVLDILLLKFEFWYTKLSLGDIENIDLEYLKNLYGLNKTLSFTKDGEIFKAAIIGVGESGKLYLRRDDGKILKLMFKEVEFNL